MHFSSTTSISFRRRSENVSVRWRYINLCPPSLNIPTITTPTDHNQKNPNLHLTMLFLNLVVAAFASSAVSAVPLEARQSTDLMNQSAPFYLKLSSRNATYDGAYLFAGHAGAAIESLIPTTNRSIASTFYFNTTINNSPLATNNVTGTPGILGYTLVGVNFVAPSAARLSYDPSTSVAAVQFLPSNTSNVQLAFDPEDRLNVPNYGFIENKQPEALLRFYICRLYTGGYSYTSLGFGLGARIPDNRTCRKVTVLREYV